MRCEKCSIEMGDEVVCPKCGLVHETELPRLDLNKLSTPKEKKKYANTEQKPRRYYHERGKRGIFAIVDLYKRTFDFNGVTDWFEYWTQYLFIFVFSTANFLTRDVVRIEPIDFSSARFWIFSTSLIVLVFTIIPGISSTVRRLHDVGYSGVNYFLVFIPFFGPIMLIIILLLPYNRSEFNDFYEKYNLGE